MESRANYVLIGIFVLCAIAAGFGFIYWLTGAGEQAGQAQIRVVFSGPVTGLTTGSAVQFNGIKIGEVARLSLDEEDPQTVIAIIRVDRDKPIRTDTRAILSYQGLTGVATLQLEGGSRNAPLLIETVPEEEGIPTIEAEISPFQDIVDSARNVLTRADSAMAAIDDFIKENGPAFNRTVNNVEVFSKALADNAPGIDDTLRSIAEASEALGRISTRLEATAGEAESILAAIDPAEVTQIVARVSEASVKLDAVLARAEEVAAGIDPATVTRAVDSVARAGETLEATLDRAKAVLEGVDPADLEATLAGARTAFDEISAAANRADTLLAAVDETQLRSIVDGVDSTVKAIGEGVGKLNASLEGGGEGLVSEATLMVKEIRAAAETLNARLGPIANNLERFTSRGLDNYVELAREGRRLLARLSQVVGTIERDPQRFLFGGEGVPEYRPRRR